jgi:hypothetical protein
MVDAACGSDTISVTPVQEGLQEGVASAFLVHQTEAGATTRPSCLSDLTPAQKQLVVVTLLQRAFRKRNEVKIAEINETTISPSKPFSKNLPASAIARLLVKASTTDSLRDTPRPLTRSQAIRDTARTANIFARQLRDSTEGSSCILQPNKQQTTAGSSKKERQRPSLQPHHGKLSAPTVLFVHSPLFVNANSSQKARKIPTLRIPSNTLQYSPPVSPKAVAKRLLRGSNDKSLKLSPRGPKLPSRLGLNSDVPEAEHDVPTQEIERKDHRELSPYTEEHRLAATTLQRAFRRRQSYRLGGQRESHQ